MIKFLKLFALLIIGAALVSSCNTIRRIKKPSYDGIDTTYKATLPPPPSPSDTDYVATPDDPGFTREVQARRRAAEERSITVIDTIPVMFTVVYSAQNPSSNISDEQIIAQVTATNKHFADNNVPIRVKLARRDNNGQPSSGIVRVNGDVVPNFAASGVQKGTSTGAVESTVKNLNRWDVNRVVNSWIIPEINGNNGNNGIQAWAYFPLSPLYDGIMIMHTVTGATDINQDGVKDPGTSSWTVKGSMSHGKVWTHELAHHLRLYHTFQGQSCSTESNCNIQGDQCCDTRPRRQGSSCTVPACPPVPGQDPSTYVFIDNIMDYGTQSCLKLLTPNQSARMSACLATQRPGLLNSPFLTSPATVDAGLTILAAQYTCTGTAPVSATVQNLGITTITSVEVNGITYTVNILQGKSQTFSLPNLTIVSGSLTKVYTLEKVNGAPDSNTANNTASINVERITGETLKMEMTLDYFGNENSWTVTDVDGNIVWVSPLYPGGKNKLVVKTETCLPPGEYKLNMKDTRGDAQFMNLGALTAGAGFKLYVGGNLAVSSMSCWCSNTHADCRNCYEKSFIFNVE